MIDALDNLQKIEEVVAQAARRVNRDPASVKVVVVSKTVAPERIAPVLTAGYRALGENRPQELLAKHPLLPGAEWHLIGHLQTNKVKGIIDKVALIHSLDRWHLAEEISKRAQGLNLVAPVLVQVNVAGEETKFGLAPEEVADFVREAAVLPGIKVQGLMTIAPYVSNPEEVRPVFRGLKNLAAEIGALHIPNVEMTYLSMGMSNDFEVAVEEGANIIRLGSAVFGPRK